MKAQQKNIIGVEFYNVSYDLLEIPKNSVIYCDPPYQDTTKYKDKIDYEHFWQWCRELKNDGHTVFISEYNAPNDFICLWEKEVNNSLTKDTGAKKGVEKLFTI